MTGPLLAASDGNNKHTEARAKKCEGGRLRDRSYVTNEKMAV